jgi:hypothetical protein
MAWPTLDNQAAREATAQLVALGALAHGYVHPLTSERLKAIRLHALWEARRAGDRATAMKLDRAAEICRELIAALES